MTRTASREAATLQLKMVRTALLSATIAAAASHEMPAYTVHQLLNADSPRGKQHCQLGT